MRFEKVFIPYGAFWSTPFCRWQGSLSAIHPLKLAADCATRKLDGLNCAPTRLDGLHFGMTVPQHQSFFGARGLYGVVAEDNLSLLVGAGLGYARSGGSAAFRVEPLMSAEFFLFGLENLGLTLQWGLQLDLGGSGTAFRSIGSGAAIGAHYWF